MIIIKVSIIVPVYNTEKYLDKCLHSLVNQTLDLIEIIIVNDGSTDKSQVIIDDYLNKYPQKVKMYIKTNSGLSEARNFGIEKAIGEYIGFVDSDDYVNLDMFKSLYETAILKNADIVECDYKNFYYKQEEIVFFEPDNKTNKKYQDILINENKGIIDEITDMAWNKIYRQKLFIEFTIRYPKGLWHEDYATTPILISKSDKYVQIDNVGYYYLQRENSITHYVSSKSLDVINGFNYMINEMKRLESYNNFEEELYQKYKGLLVKIMFIIINLRKKDHRIVKFKNVVDRLYLISYEFHKNFNDESSFYIRELSKAIISKNYVRFAIIIYLNQIKDSFLSIFKKG
ncbi:glycosyltransferase [Clostridium bowmanii]|uniref:glycosyltransferase n=1 Tax=Clostridium bowmanii TaxID=132925 RepID=UPI001C0E5B5F|nr:glycosyltransferase [Clostridium bowmanii]MBU3191226.1 glycosyltransferase [Clostridium bowmanii]MCA1075674.1 glycosyltransferase [Clostridium bowmanii]